MTQQNANEMIQQAVGIICQYASGDWSEMGTNFSLKNKTIDAYITIGDAEYSIGFDDEDTETLKSLFSKISKDREKENEFLALEFDNEGNYELTFE